MSILLNQLINIGRQTEEEACFVLSLREQAVAHFARRLNTRSTETEVGSSDEGDYHTTGILEERRRKVSYKERFWLIFAEETSIRRYHKRRKVPTLLAEASLEIFFLLLSHTLLKASISSSRVQHRLLTLWPGL
jgi:hypothetical protein